MSSNEQLMGWLRQEDGHFIPSPPPCTPSSTWTPLYRKVSPEEQISQRIEANLMGDALHNSRWKGGVVSEQCPQCKRHDPECAGSPCYYLSSTALSDQFLEQLAISYTLPAEQIGCNYHYSKTTIIGLLRNLVYTVETRLRSKP